MTDTDFVHVGYLTKAPPSKSTFSAFSVLLHYYFYYEHGMPDTS